MKKPRFCRGAVGMSNSFIGRRESNPRPEIFSCSFYTLSPRFKVRLGGLPGTGSLVGYPVSCFASPATGDQGRLSWLILRPVRAVRRTRQDEAT